MNYFNRRGWAYYCKGEFDKAIADFDAAIQSDPFCSVFFNNRGLAYDSKGEFDKAIADFTRALHLEPESAVLFFNRGLAWISKKNYAKALFDFSEAVRLEPDNPDFNESLKKAKLSAAKCSKKMSRQLPCPPEPEYQAQGLPLRGEGRGATAG